MGKVIAFIGLLFFQSLSAQDGRIPWMVGQKLSWADFQTGEKGRNRFAAESSCGLFYSLTQEGDRTLVSVFAYFLPTESWVVAGKQNDRLLAHEQLHFDIAEFWSRKMKKSFAKYELPVKTFIKQKADKKMKDEYNRFFKEMMKMQQRYDSDTAHGTNEREQAKWEKDIQRRLDGLSQFAPSAAGQ